MFKLNLKIAWRNLWKNKAYSVFNIFGLAVGLAGFIIILLYINREQGFDKWNPALNRTYMVAADFTQNGAENKGSKIKALFAKTIEAEFPSVEAISIGWLNGNANLRTETNGKVIKEKLSSVSMDDKFFAVYPLTAINGRMQDVFRDKNAIAISKTAALKMFGEENPINKVLIQNRGLNEKEQELVVKAVWDDKKQPSYFGFDVFYAADFSIYGGEFLSRTFSTMLTFRDGVDAESELSKMNDAYTIALAKFVANNSDVNFKPSKQQALAILKDKEGITSFKLIYEPVSDLNLGTFYSTQAKRTTINILLALASFLVIISCINYTNLSLVLAQKRAKEVGVKKVLGAQKINLLKQFFAETALQCIIAYLFALIIAELLVPKVNNLLDTQLSLFSSSNISLVLGQALLILLAVIAMAGAYPAFVLAGFRPVKVLKGNFNTAKHIGSLRKVLVVCQFTIAIALVISFMVMLAQLEFMRNKDLGLNKSQLMTLDIGNFAKRNLSPAAFQSIKDRLLAISGVDDLTRATEEPINDSGFNNDLSFAGKKLNVESRFVDVNYLKVIGGKVVEGRDFSTDLIATDSVQSILLNETAFAKLGLTSVNQQIGIDHGDDIKQFNVIGKVKDIQAYGFEHEVVPTVYLVADYQFHWRRNIILRLKPENIASTIEEIKKTWMEIEPGRDPIYSFADETFQKMNKAYETSNKVIFYFGSLTLIISLFGLIGFAAYSAEIRTREVALRRILGATTANLLNMLNKDFLWLVIIANIFADVLAYVYMNKWFAGFAYRIPMPFEMFFTANLSIIVITILTVSWQSLRAVNSNPASVLKAE
ncbi:ABC transporter permease [Pedobacter namyangjuensis]|uniref:ABC transporter permease n=1 Tax=Pedobacter namyangjuensis TaxID=600626 RepID=UPI000DE2EF97|nr:ABC transporter permease [Pedobacter namyangjuensis]